MTKCSYCGEMNHNKRTCPHKKVSDIELSRQDFDYVEIDISDKRECLIKDLKEKEDYSIDYKMFIEWLQLRKPCSLKELRYVLDKGLNRESTVLYMNLLDQIDEFY